jgi:glycosyltransferase involved in cell wall biosynthesis
MRLLFVKPSLVFPRTSGHDVSCYYIMKSLAEQGATVSLLTASPTAADAVEGIKLEFCGQLTDDPPAHPIKLTWLQERFRSFWGTSPGQIASVRDTAERLRADVVIAYGLPALPYLAGLERPLRVWAMADEWVYHHLTQIQLTDRTTWHHLKSAVIKGAYERAYRPLVDRFWAVSDTDLRAGRWFAGMKGGDLLPNGVDTDFYRPFPTVEVARSAIFWGRLDFEPNIDALAWFCREIWPGVRQRVPDARFTIVGYSPTPQVAQAAKAPGITLLPNVDDLRATVVSTRSWCSDDFRWRHQEQAAGRRRDGQTHPLYTARCMDLRPSGALPLAQASTPADWIDQMTALWADSTRRAELGAKARTWVSEYYSWSTPARNALTAFEAAVQRRNVR